MLRSVYGYITVQREGQRNLADWYSCLGTFTPGSGAVVLRLHRRVREHVPRGQGFQGLRCQLRAQVGDCMTMFLVPCRMS